MKLYKSVLSFLLLSIYMLASLHGAIPHEHSDHLQHEESSRHDDHNHSHDHHGEEHHHIVNTSNSFLHSVLHFIESLNHNHEVVNEPIVSENKNLNSHACGAIIPNERQGLIIEQTSKSLISSTLLRFSKIYLLNSSLRGPPSIV